MSIAQEVEPTLQITVPSPIEFFKILEDGFNPKLNESVPPFHRGLVKMMYKRANPHEYLNGYQDPTGKVGLFVETRFSERLNLASVIQLDIELVGRRPIAGGESTFGLYGRSTRDIQILYLELDSDLPNDISTEINQWWKGCTGQVNNSKPAADLHTNPQPKRPPDDYRVNQYSWYFRWE